MQINHDQYQYSLQSKIVCLYSSNKYDQDTGKIIRKHCSRGLEKPPGYSESCGQIKRDDTYWLNNFISATHSIYT